jgi:hypothetical protein
MPKVKNPLFSQEARGGLAGLVFNTWRGINTVKTNTSPTGQGTAKRLAAQALLSAISKAWAGITDAQRLAWGQYAIDHPVTDWTGSPKRLTGMNWYARCNVMLSYLGNALISDPPIDAAPDPATGFAVSQTGDDLVASWTTPVGAGPNIEFWIAGPLSAGRSAKLEQAARHSSIAANTAQPYHLLVAPAVGRYTVFARIVDVDNGLTSTYMSDFTDIT